jgi:hypothetical protein
MAVIKQIFPLPYIYTGKDTGKTSMDKNKFAPWFRGSKILADTLASSFKIYFWGTCFLSTFFAIAIRKGLKKELDMPLEQPQIRNCEFKYKCLKTWEGLESLENYPEGVKYCSTCQRDVFLVETDLELKMAVWANRCVAIPLKMRISMIEDKALKKMKAGHTVGHVSFENLPKSPLKGI